MSLSMTPDLFKPTQAQKKFLISLADGGDEVHAGNQITCDPFEYNTAKNLERLDLIVITNYEKGVDFEVEVTDYGALCINHILKSMPKNEVSNESRVESPSP